MRRCLFYLVSCLSILGGSACAPKLEGDSKNGSEFPVSGAEDSTQTRVPELAGAGVIAPTPTPTPTPVPVPILDEPVLEILTETTGWSGLGGGGGSGHDLCPMDPNKRRPGVCGCGVLDSDQDVDGIIDCVDNCALVANLNQIDSDSDSVGDACDNCVLIVNIDQADGDSDSIGNVCDNCLLVANTDQINSDADPLGDACDNCPTDANANQADGDLDTVGDVCDNCLLIANADQSNSDEDSLGDACDNCPNDANTNQADADADTVGDVCDNCVLVSNVNQVNSDTDPLGDVCDNCIFDANADQLNADGDSVGEACDCDDHNADLGALPMGATAYYVDPAVGNDANSCLTPAAACETIAGALGKASDGDVILLSAATFPEGNLTVVDDVFIFGKGPRNSIVDASGISAPRRVFTISASSTTTICGVTITGGLENTGAGGGGILNSGDLTLSSVTIRNNFVQGVTGTTGTTGAPNPGGVGGAGGIGGTGGDGFGGGIYNEGTIPAILHSTISANNASGGTGGAGGPGGTGMTTGSGGPGGLGGNGNGGGIYNASGGTISSIVNSTISGNSANQSLGGPGGVGLPPGAAGTPGTSFGGGINNAMTGQVTVANSTITNNQVSGVASLGGGVFNAGTFSINHTIIADQAGGTDDCSGIITDTAPNLDSDGTCGGSTTSATINLGVLQNNGGPTDTHALGGGSSAINTGDPTCGVAIDQRGEPRPPLGGGINCDIGAFEDQP